MDSSEKNFERKIKKVGIMNEITSLIRIAYNEFGVTKKDIDFCAKLASMNNEELAIEAQKSIERTKKAINDSSLSTFLEFMKEEDCEHCSAIDNCEIKTLYEKIQRGEADGEDVLKQAVNFTEFEKSMGIDSDNDVFGNMFKDLL